MGATKLLNKNFKAMHESKVNTSINQNLGDMTSRTKARIAFDQLMNQNQNRSFQFGNYHGHQLSNSNTTQIAPSTNLSKLMARLDD